MTVTCIFACVDARLGCGLTCVHSLLHLRIRSDMLSESPFVAPLCCYYALMDLFWSVPVRVHLTALLRLRDHGAVCSFERCRSLRRLPPSSATEGRDMELPTFRAGQYVDYSNGVIFRDFILFIPYAEIIVPTLKVVGLLPWILF